MWNSIDRIVDVDLCCCNKLLVAVADTFDDRYNETDDDNDDDDDNVNDGIVFVNNL